MEGICRDGVCKRYRARGATRRLARIGFGWPLCGRACKESWPGDCAARMANVRGGIRRGSPSTPRDGFPAIGSSPLSHSLDRRYSYSPLVAGSCCRDVVEYAVRALVAGPSLVFHADGSSVAKGLCLLPFGGRVDDRRGWYCRGWGGFGAFSFLCFFLFRPLPLFHRPSESPRRR